MYPWAYPRMPVLYEVIWKPPIIEIKSDKKVQGSFCATRRQILISQVLPIFLLNHLFKYAVVYAPLPRIWTIFTCKFSRQFLGKKTGLAWSHTSLMCAAKANLFRTKSLRRVLGQNSSVYMGQLFFSRGGWGVGVNYSKYKQVIKIFFFFF